MNLKSIRKLLLAGVMVVVLLLAFAPGNRPSAPANGNSVYSLQAPSFVGVAKADVASTTYLEGEAGISAYFQASTSIDLAAVKDVFRTIETETADYIIGSVPVADYPESEDVHVYVHRDGWLLAYYPAADPAGKIFDWRRYHDTGRTNITTKLDTALAVVAGEAGVSFTSATYYDFRYPNATHLMLIVDWVYDGTDSFEIKLPGSFTYDERSWSLGSDYYHYAVYKLDEVTIKGRYSGGSGWGTSQGILTAAQLLPDQFHTIEVAQDVYPHYAYGGLALVYRVP